MVTGILAEIRPYGRENYVSKLDPMVGSIVEKCTLLSLTDASYIYTKCSSRGDNTSHYSLPVSLCMWPQLMFAMRYMDIIFGTGY